MRRDKPLEIRVGRIIEPVLARANPLLSAPVITPVLERAIIARRKKLEDFSPLDDNL